MKVGITPSSLHGVVVIPAGKSEAQRVVAVALLCEGLTHVFNYPENDDSIAALRCARSLGAEIMQRGNEWVITGNPPQTAQVLSEITVLDCGESGLSARIFSSVAALYSTLIELTGRNGLNERPFKTLHEVFEQIGVEFSSNDGRLPLRIRGPMIPADVILDGSVSSQFVSGLLIAMSALPESRRIEVRGMQSFPYVKLTVEVLSHFGVEWSCDPSGVFLKQGGALTAAHIIVPGDWSSAATMLVAAALCASEGVVVEGVSMSSFHADRAVISLLDAAGIPTYIKANGIEVRAGNPTAFDFDFSDCPDLVPIAIVLAASSNGVCTLYNTSRLRFKESDRGRVMQMELRKAGVVVSLSENSILVNPARGMRADFNAHGDHRIAMALTLFALAHRGGTIEGAECVAKSYPNFFSDLVKLGSSLHFEGA